MTRTRTPRDDECIPITIRLSPEDYAYLITSQKLTDDVWLDAVMALAMLTLRDHIDLCKQWRDDNPRLAGTSAFPDDPLLDCILTIRPGIHREQLQAIRTKCLAGRRSFNAADRGRTGRGHTSAKRER